MESSPTQEVCDETSKSQENILENKSMKESSDMTHNGELLIDNNSYNLKSTTQEVCEETPSNQEKNNVSESNNLASNHESSTMDTVTTCDSNKNIDSTSSITDTSDNNVDSALSNPSRDDQFPENSNNQSVDNMEVDDYDDPPLKISKTDDKLKENCENSMELDANSCTNDSNSEKKDVPIVNETSTTVESDCTNKILVDSEVTTPVDNCDDSLNVKSMSSVISKENTDLCQNSSSAAELTESSTDKCSKDLNLIDEELSPQSLASASESNDKQTCENNEVLAVKEADISTSEPMDCSDDTITSNQLQDNIFGLDLSTKKPNDKVLKSDMKDNLKDDGVRDLDNGAENATTQSEVKDSDEISATLGTDASNESSSAEMNALYVELSDEETGFPEFLKGLVTIGRYISVKGDFTLKSCESLLESASLMAPYVLKEPDTFPSREQPLKQDKAFFQSSIGEFLVGLGLSRAMECFHRDMVLIKTKQMKKDVENKFPQLEQDLKNHQNCYTQAKLANKPYAFSDKLCSKCNFKTESSIVMEGHLLVPHLSSRREYQCNFCLYMDRDPKNIIKHMKVTHNKNGNIPPSHIMYECPFCIYDNTSKTKYTTHVGKCMKYFDGSINQAPLRDIEFPCLTPKPVTVAMVKAYVKTLTNMQMRYKKPKKLDVDYQMLSDTSYLYSSQPPDVSVHKGLKPAMAHSSLGFPSQHYPSRYMSYATPSGMPLEAMPYPTIPTPLKSKNQFKNAASLGLPQLPKLQGPYPAHMDNLMPHLPQTPNSLVVCEICDGYIKDMEQLRTHMQLIHKVKIHPKVFSSRPPLNCQKCMWRFFTDQGLERHLLGSHGLVTSNMQEMANKSKDAGCCTICGRVFASKLVAHMNQVHKVTLKPAHLSYKCTVCSATFNLYRLFENHVYLVHSGASKRPAEGDADLPPNKKKAATTSSLDKNSPLNKDKHSRSLAEKQNGTA